MWNIVSNEPEPYFFFTPLSHTSFPRGMESIIFNPLPKPQPNHYATTIDYKLKIESKTYIIACKHKLIA